MEGFRCSGMSYLIIMWNLKKSAKIGNLPGRNLLEKKTSSFFILFFANKATSLEYSSKMYILKMFSYIIKFKIL